MALFRMVGGCAGVLYNYFALKYANTHMQEIFLATGVLYLVGFALMCWKVREGSYPPPSPNLGNEKGFLAALRTYGAECFSHRFYWLFFVTNSVVAITWVTASYSLLVTTKIVGLDLDFIGKLGSFCGIVSIILLYPAGILADRFHPLRILIAACIAQVVLAPLSITFMFTRTHFSLHTATWIWIALSLVNLPVTTLYAASELPTFMRLLPKERYGQFCSANALLRSVTLILGGIACGIFLDFAKKFGATPDDCYRFVPVWNFVFQSGALFLLFALYREWQRLGGLKCYTPPQSDAIRNGTAASTPQHADPCLPVA